MSEKHMSETFAERYGNATVAQMRQFPAMVQVSLPAMNDVLNVCAPLTLTLAERQVVDLAEMASSTLILISEGRAPASLRPMALETVLAYVHLRNRLKLSASWMVGEEHEQIERVYHALITTHQERVAEAMMSIEGRGVQWGSAMRNRTENLALYVSTWEQDYTFKRTYVSVPCPPELRPVVVNTAVVFACSHTNEQGGDATTVRGTGVVKEVPTEEQRRYIVTGDDDVQYAVEPGDLVAINDPQWVLAKRAAGPRPAVGRVTYAGRRGCLPVMRMEATPNRALAERLRG